MSSQDLIPDGSYISYDQSKQDTGIKYGSDNLQSILDTLVPIVAAKLSRSGGSWTSLRIQGATLTSVTEGAGTLDVELALDTPLEVNGTGRLAMNAPNLAAGAQVCATHAVATLSNTNVDGDTLNVLVTGYDAPGAGVYTPADGDVLEFTISNP